MSEEAKQNAWAEHYERLLYVEFELDPEYLSNKHIYPNHLWQGEEDHLYDEVGKVAGPSGIVVEMIKASSDTGATMIHRLAIVIFS